MHSDVTQFELIAPPSLQAVLKQLAADPGRYTPIAGGTELMVALGAGRLQQRALLSIQHLRELRFIRFNEYSVHIGSGTTFTDIRRSAELAEHLPLLARAASWTGSIANQNRGTIGGNICNASPAADTPPALLAYGASVTLVSASGERTLRYSDFHQGYKKTMLRPDELLHSIHVPLMFADHHHFLRKVGTRNAQAISKIAIAGVAKLEEQSLTDIRLGAASLTDRPVRCTATEKSLHGASLAPDALEETIRAGRAALASETHTIDDIRSTARYRAAVAGNLLEEFLRSLAG